MKLHLNPYLAGILFLVIILFANALAYIVMRSTRGLSFGWFRNLKRSTKEPYEKEEKQWDELHRRVAELNKKDS
jgi:hypothetical protein